MKRVMKFCRCPSVDPIDAVIDRGYLINEKFFCQGRLLRAESSQ